MTTQDRFAAAIEDLGQRGIPFVFSRNTITTGDAWCVAAEQHGDRIAFAHVSGGYWDQGVLCWAEDGKQGAVTTLYVSYHYNHLDVAEAIVSSFWAQHFDASWSGDRFESVRVVLS